MTKLRVKARERLILEAVLDAEIAQRATSYERPDFLLSSDAAPRRGIEVTEHYINDSSARFQQKPDYAAELLDGGLYMHSDDRAFLRVEDMELVRQDGSRSKLRGIVSTWPSIDSYCESIADRVRAKTSKHRAFTPEADCCDLIVYEGDHRFRDVERDELLGALLASECLREALWTSTFSEIYLLTAVRDDGAIKLVYAPLTVGAVLYELFLLEALVSSQRRASTFSSLLRELARHLSAKSIWPAVPVGAANALEIRYRRHGFLIRDRKPTVREYECSFGRPSNRPTKSRVASQLERARRSVAFRCGVVFDSQSEAAVVALAGRVPRPR